MNRNWAAVRENLLTELVTVRENFAMLTELVTTGTYLDSTLVALD